MMGEGGGEDGLIGLHSDVGGPEGADGGIAFDGLIESVQLRRTLDHCD